MGLTLQIQVDGRPVPQLTARWQRLEVLHRIGDAHDTATLTLAAAGTALPLPPAGAQLVFQVTQEGERPLDLGGRFALRGLAGDTASGTVTLEAAAVDPASTLREPRDVSWRGQSLASIAQAIAVRADLDAAVAPSMGRRILAARVQTAESDHQFLRRLVTRLGGRLVIQDGHLIITAAGEAVTASGAALPPLVVDLTVTGAWVRWRQQSSTRLGQAAAAYVGDDGVSRGAVTADADTAPMRRLPTTYPSREEAAGAATQALADAETAAAELELRLPFTPDAHVLHPVVLEAVPATLRAVLATLPPRWTLHQVRHQLGSRAAATTLTCRPAPAQTPAVLDHPPLTATPLPLAPRPLPRHEPTVPAPPTRLAVVQQVAAETGYPTSGISATAFTQLVAQRLHAEDPRWGRRITATGPIGKDTVAYRLGDAPANPFSVAIIFGVGGLVWSAHSEVDQKF